MGKGVKKKGERYLQINTPTIDINSACVVVEKTIHLFGDIVHEWLLFTLSKETDDFFFFWRVVSYEGGL